MRSFRQQLNRVVRQQVHLAGPRFSPGIDFKAPNIEIAPLVLAVDTLAIDRRFCNKIDELRATLDESMRYSRSVEQLFVGRAVDPTRLTSALDALKSSDPSNVSMRVRFARRSATSITRRLEARQTALETERQAATSDDEKRSLQSTVTEIFRYQRAIREMIEFLSSPTGGLLRTNRLLILGEWGTGKTHFLCDLALRRMQRRRSTLLVLAQHLPVGADPLAGVCHVTGLARTPAALLGKLDRAGKAEGGRALLMVDAINEGDHLAWRRWMDRSAALLDAYPNVGVILSCRRPFNAQIVSARASRAWTSLEHTGFTDVEFDAQLEFFKFYNIPTPQFPLLTEEFARPLFLKILCETIRDLTQKSKKAYLRSLASGQKGMTRALEDFVKRIGRKIEQDFGLPPLTCWKLLKGEIVAGTLAGITPTMAAHVRDYVTPSEALDAIRAITGLTSAADAQTFLQRLLADGLLMQSSRWSESVGMHEVIVPPYQRFSDHLVARHLLRTLETTSVTAIKRSFYRNRPLGKVFDLDQWSGEFAMPGIASAIMLEFPERVKGVLPVDQRELAMFIPRGRRLVQPIRAAFLDGLRWRAADSFTAQTDRILASFLAHGNEWDRNEVLEMLVELATRPGHPVSADSVAAYLTSMSLAERDLTWTEFLRMAEDRSVVFRVIEWVDRVRGTHIEAESAKSLIVLLSWCLTTTRKPLRDIATRALVQLGLQHPALLFERGVTSLAVNDPYVWERMLAAAYGVAMNGWADPKHAAVQTALPTMGRQLLMSMFAPGAPHPTRHTLAREYALGIIALAVKVDSGTVAPAERAWLTSPFDHLPEGFPAPDTIADNAAEQMSSALRMDFENYTIGNLVADRRNYDAQHPEYRAVRKQLLWRVGELGYSSSLFDALDRRIAESAPLTRSQEPQRTERYGKKYSWIAYFELYGLQSDRRRLKDYRMGQRCSDVDIDPSFPPEPVTWTPRLQDVFASAPSEHRQWLGSGPVPDYRALYVPRDIAGARGPWVLLDGHISHRHADGRELVTHLRTLLTESRQLRPLEKALQATKHPGNDVIPEPADEPYTFGGEVPWSINYARSIRNPDGTARPDEGDAFERYAGGKWIGVPVEMPVRNYAWEGYHSSANTVGGISLLAPHLAGVLDLVNHAETWKLFDRDGRQATAVVAWPEGQSFFRSELFYIRKTLLARYLRQTNLSATLVAWGERSLHHELLNSARDELIDVLEAGKNVHKNMTILEV